MNKKQIKIKKGQHLSDINQIESNTILCKTLTGLGATYSEIKADRDSIIIEPNQPAIIGKYKSKIHRSDNLFPVMQGVTTLDVIDYLEKTIKDKKQIKILTTPESFSKVKQAFEEVEENMYFRCFLLLDECQKYVQDNDYREDITLPIDDFFEFEEKAMVSATPIISSDPRFDKEKFTLVEIVPEYEYKTDITILPTNNVLETLKRKLPEIIENQSEPRSICMFVNSTDMIHQLIDKLGIKEETAVFCATKSVDKLKRKGFKKAYHQWDKSKMKQYNFFTSRFYTALDMELDYKPDIIFITEPYISEYTAVDPLTDVVQSIGRFRNGISSCLHIVTPRKDFLIRTKEGIIEYLKGCEYAYNTIKNLYDCATTEETRKAFKDAMEVLPYHRFIKSGKKDWFAIDNYIDEQLVKSAYNNIDLLMERYRRVPTLNTVFLSPMNYSYSYYDRLKFENKSGNIKENRKEMVKILDSLKDDRDSMLVRYYVEELRKLDRLIVEAYETVGKEVIEVCHYSQMRINEAMILKKCREKTTGLEFIELLNNSFKVGERYTKSYIKKELERIYKVLDIKRKGAITAQTIKEFFHVEEVWIKKKRSFRLIERKI